MSRRTYFLILGLGIFLRLFLIWNAGLWYDENFSLLLSRLPLANMLMATAGDVHPPLYYILIWPLGQIPQLPPWVIRIPSAIISIATLAIYPRLIKHFNVPNSVQVLAFGLLAVLPMQLHYAQEARMYALLELLMVVGALAIFEDRRTLLAVTIAALLYTQNYGLFYTITLFGLIIIDYMFSPKGISLQGALVAGVIAWLPWIPIMRGQMNYINSNYWIFDITPGGILYEIWKLFWAFSMTHPGPMILSMLTTFAWLILAIFYLFTKRPPYWYDIGILAFGPIVISLLVSYLIQPVILFRPLIGVTPFLYLACAYPLGMIDSTRLKLYASCFILPLVLMSLVSYYYYLPQQKQQDGTGNMQAAVDYIDSHWQPGDLIFNASDMSYINLKPYTDLPQYSNPDCTKRFPGAISDTTSTALNIQTRSQDQLPPHKRLWYVAVLSPMLPECELARTNEIVDGASPTFTMQDNKFILSAVWLLEGK